MPKYLLLIILAAIFYFGCTINDEDRCTDGMYWDAKMLACRLDAGEDGYLEPCKSQEECDVFGSGYYCLVDPSKDDPGICVVQGCETAETCPEDLLCCDCTILPATLCLAESIVKGSDLEPVCECTP